MISCRHFSGQYKNRIRGGEGGFVSRFAQEVRRSAGKQKGRGSITLGSPFSSKRLWFVDTVL